MSGPKHKALLRLRMDLPVTELRKDEVRGVIDVSGWEAIPRMKLMSNVFCVTTFRSFVPTRHTYRPPRHKQSIVNPVCVLAG